MSHPSGALFPQDLLFPGDPTFVTTYYFVSPITVGVPSGRDKFWSHFTQRRGVSLLKYGSSYQEIEGPSEEQIEAADVVYLGGRLYTIDSNEAAALTTAGYGAGVTPSTEAT